MTTAELVALRKLTGLTQSQMAERIGLSFRAYQDVETGGGDVRPRHAAAIERASLALAVERQNPSLAMDTVRREAVALAKLMSE